MVALWTFQVVTELSRFALVVSPDLVAASWASALVHIGYIISLRNSPSSRVRATPYGGFTGMRRLDGSLLLFGFGLLLPNLSVGCRHD